MRSRTVLLVLLALVLVIGAVAALLASRDDAPSSLDGADGTRPKGSVPPGLRGTSPPEDRLWKEPGEVDDGAEDEPTGPRPVPPAMKTLGQVVGTDGKPLATARVFYKRRFGGTGRFETVAVDAEGRFEIPWMARGTSLVVHASASPTSFPYETVDGKGLVRAGAQDLRIVVDEGETLTVEVPMLREPGFGEGVAADGIRVQVVQYGRDTAIVLETTLDADGAARFGGIQRERGSYVVHVGPDGTGRSARGSWNGGPGALELAWKRAATIEGRIADAPMKGVRVDVKDPNGFIFRADVIDGVFAVEGLEPNLAFCMARARVIGHIHETPWVRCAPGDRDVVLSFPAR